MPETCGDNGALLMISRNSHLSKIIETFQRGGGSATAAASWQQDDTDNAARWGANF
jgi:hypothetical protein